MTLIDTIENLFKNHEDDATETLLEIKMAIQDSKTSNIANVKDGEHFSYKGIEFIRLGEEQGGVLCMVATPFKVCAFDESNHNDWRKSSARKLLKEQFLPLLNEADLLPFESDLIADNGDTAYGKCIDKVSLLSCDLYRKYRNFVPLFDDWMWTCTPWYCDGGACTVRLVHSDGTVSVNIAYNSYALAPACIIRNQ